VVVAVTAVQPMKQQWRLKADQTVKQLCSSSVSSSSVLATQSPFETPADISKYGRVLESTACTQSGYKLLDLHHANQDTYTVSQGNKTKSERYNLHLHQPIFTIFA